MTQDLTDKVVIVTGGGSGIGRASALAFARAGASVAVADVDVTGGEETAQLIHQDGGQAIFVRTDVSRAFQVEQLVNHTVDKFGWLDCAFNNAGINEEHGTVVDCTEELWEYTLGVNLKGIWLCLKYEIPQMLKKGGGAIVNTASIVGLSSARNVPAYVASKYGVIGLTRATARDFGKQGIRVNAVCPGTIRTPMYVRRLGDDPAADARLASESVMGRLGTAEDIADVVVWLCSDAARFVNGHSLLADGGDLA
jgi:NAD(P)-dependent dehydrogenase (short-subunit alcohol dehydrogenase family)